MEMALAEKYALKPIGTVANAATGSPGARISLKGGDRLAIVLLLGSSTGSAVTFSLKQHDAATAGNSKALAVQAPYWYKVSPATSFTKIQPTSAADTYDFGAAFGGAEGVIIFEVLAEDLDVNNGYAYVSVDTGATTSAKIIGGFYALGCTRNFPAYQTAL